MKQRHTIITKYKTYLNFDFLVNHVKQLQTNEHYFQSKSLLNMFYEKFNEGGRSFIVVSLK